MLRKRAIRSLLVEEVAALRLPELDDEPEEGTEEGTTEAASGDGELQLREEQQSEALHGAERRTRLIVALDWIALAVLFVLRDTTEAFLPFGATTDTVFTLGVVAVAIHSGFRLGQLEKYRAIARVYERLR